jgi:hypothetical protein
VIEKAGMKTYAGDFFGEVGVRPELVVEWIVLARGFDAVGENVLWGVIINELLGELVGGCGSGCSQGWRHFVEDV